MTHAVETAPRRVEKQVRKNLAVPLTDEEVKAKTDQMVADMTELEKLEQEHAVVKKAMSAETKQLKADISKARKVIVTKVETKIVEDAVQVYDLDKKRSWVEYRGQEFDNIAMSEFELKAMIKPPLFPEHEDAAVEGARGELDEDDDLNVKPLPPNVSEIDEVRRSETKKGGRKDHTASK